MRTLTHQLRNFQMIWACILESLHLGSRLLGRFAGLSDLVTHPCLHQHTTIYAITKQCGGDCSEFHPNCRKCDSAMAPTETCLASLVLVLNTKLSWPQISNLPIAFLYLLTHACCRAQVPSDLHRYMSHRPRLRPFYRYKSFFSKSAPFLTHHVSREETEQYRKMFRSATKPMSRRPSITDGKAFFLVSEPWALSA